MNMKPAQKSPSCLKDKVAIVTGASRGIGRAIAAAYCAAGAKVVLVALHDDKLEETEREFRSAGWDVVKVCGDVSCPHTARDAVKAAGSLGPTIDILVNCAGTISREDIEATTDESWSRVIGVNLTGSFYFCREVLPRMREQQRGKVINITSQMAFMAHPSASPSYEASKAGLTALTRHIALHYAKSRVCANSIAPGSIDTDLPKSMSEEARGRLKAGIPLLRLGETEEVADLAVFLASDQADYITGQTIAITGGSLMR
jgi:3-oxoacyl-[acyl-carrier protein] reductase